MRLRWWDRTVVWWLVWFFFGLLLGCSFPSLCSHFLRFCFLAFWEFPLGVKVFAHRMGTVLLYYCRSGGFPKSLSFCL
ncbi:hypothetical protein HDK64DRAFT_272847 [Phyllosticta capitalensis]